MQQWVRCSNTFDCAHNLPRWGFPFNIQLPRTRLTSSAPGWHLECHRGFPRERHQHHGPQRWPLRGSPRNGAVHHLLPAEQAHAHHPPDQRGTVHKPAAQLPAGSLWPVSSMSLDRRWLVVCSHVSELLTCASAARSGVKIQTIYNRNVTTRSQRVRTENQALITGIQVCLVLFRRKTVWIHRILDSSFWK